MFGAIFDARKEFENDETSMVRLDTEKIMFRDIVAVEAYVQRYVHRQDAPMQPRGVPVNWDQVPFRVGLELLAISLLATPRDSPNEHGSLKF